MVLLSELVFPALVFLVVVFPALVFPLVVVGMNSIFIYVMSSLSRGWMSGALKAHLPDGWTEGFWGPVVEKCGVLAVLWLLCFWLYRQRAFLRL